MKPILLRTPPCKEHLLWARSSTHSGDLTLSSHGPESQRSPLCVGESVQLLSPDLAWKGGEGCLYLQILCVTRMLLETSKLGTCYRAGASPHIDLPCDVSLIKSFLQEGIEAQS